MIGLVIFLVAMSYYIIVHLIVNTPIFNFSNKYNRVKSQYFNNKKTSLGSNETQEEKDYRYKLIKKIKWSADSGEDIINGLQNKVTITLFSIVAFTLLYFITPESKIMNNIISYIIDSFIPSTIDRINRMYSLNIGHFSEAFVEACLKLINGFITFLLSLCLTIFFFSYRMRNSFAVSSNSISNSNSLYLMIFMLLCDSLYGWAMIYPNAEKAGLTIKICVYLHLTILCLFITYYTFRNILNDLVLKKFTASLLTNIHELLMLLSFKSTETKHILLETNIETFYQTLKSLLEKNMSKLYKERISDWEKVLEDFTDGEKQYEFLQEVFIDMIYHNAKENFDSLYKILISCHSDLIYFLLKENRLSDLQISLNILNALTPKNFYKDDLKKVYATNLHEIMYLVLENHSDRLKFVINNLEEYSLSIKGNEQNNSSLLIYEGLLMRCVEQKDLNNINLLVYSMLKVNQNQNNIQKDKVNTRYNIISQNSDFEQNANNTEKAIIYMIFQLITKCIESSYYAGAGFLIKFFVTNFHSNRWMIEILKEFIEDEEVKGEHNKFISEEVTEIASIAKFNHSTFRYCCNKMNVLLYGQLKYAHNVHSELLLPYKQELIDYNFADFNIGFNTQGNQNSTVPYFEYVVSKIENSSNSYGLLYLKDTDFMKQLKQEMFDEIKEKIKTH
ncbi:hypothetical protein [Bacillus velezensis]|uniref:hypothetical protein n=1 Tax=Bacillus velezensis TaxID=492670 RepID=UPI002415A704|nr:hypothetical protein [Bacillus velezensis]WFO88520.1 hypothetical protein JEQ16_06120 [Bacillus velezensis]